jgi:hypothetical protein
MARMESEKNQELYDNYPTFNKFQVAFLKIVTDPINRVEKITDKQIAETVGVSRKTIYRYWQDPDMRKAIANETNMKSAASKPDIVRTIEDMALKRGAYKNIKTSEQLKALKLWKEVNVDLFSGRHSAMKPGEATESEVDKELLNLEREYEADSAKDEG